MSLNLPTSFSDPPQHIHAYRSANFPMFRKLQCGCNPVLNIHVTSFHGTIPLTFLHNLLNNNLSFTETLQLQTAVTQLHTLKLEKKPTPPHFQMTNGKTLITQYKPAFKKHVHGEYHRTNFVFHIAETSEDRQEFFDTLATALDAEIREGEQDEAIKTPLHALLYIIPCPFCYRDTLNQSIEQKTFLWNIMNKLEEASKVKVPIFIGLDHLDSSFDWRKSDILETVIKIETNRMDKDTLLNLPHGIVCPIFGGVSDHTSTEEFLKFYQLDEYHETLFPDISLQFGFKTESMLATIQETLFKHVV